MWQDGVALHVSREVTDGVHLLEVGWPEPVGANAYLIDDGDLTLVDAGLPVGRRRLTTEIASAGYDPTGLDRVLLTHYDADHVGGLRAVDGDVPVHLGAPDAALLEGDWKPPWTHPKGPYHRVFRRLYPLSDRDLRPVLDREQVGQFRALHTPGHNPGHTVYVHDALDTAFLGDLVRVSGGRFRPPPWIDTYDGQRARESIARVGAESVDHGCAGHGSPVTPDAGDALADLAADLSGQRP